MKSKKRVSPKASLIDKHHDLSMSIALQAIRIVEMQKQLVKLSDELLAVEGQLEKLEAEESNRVN
jgi:hypothetical protein